MFFAEDFLKFGTAENIRQVDIFEKIKSPLDVTTNHVQ